MPELFPLVKILNVSNNKYIYACVCVCVNRKEVSCNQRYQNFFKNFSYENHVVHLLKNQFFLFFFFKQDLVMFLFHQRRRN